jgi:hypothetical protein
MRRGLRLRAAALAAALQPAVVARAEVHFVVVGGLGGEPAYEQRFAAETRDLEAAGRTLSGDPSQVRALSGPAATREAVQEAFAAVARAASSEDVLLSIFIGHGNVDGTVYKLNLPGPDPTCDELRQWLDRVPARRQLVVLATSASGGCVAPLQRTGRVVLSATRSGTERNVPVFSRYFVEALRDPTADRDHDESVTALEAFRYAEQKVQRFYADAKRLATEHPTLSSDGAREFVVARRGAAARLASNVKPAPPALAARRAALETEIHALRERKAGMETGAYWTELEGRLVELARVQDSIDVATGPR